MQKDKLGCLEKIDVTLSSAPVQCVYGLQRLSPGLRMRPAMRSALGFVTLLFLGPPCWLPTQLPLSCFAWAERNGPDGRTGGRPTEARRTRLGFFTHCLCVSPAEKTRNGSRDFAFPTQGRFRWDQFFVRR